MKKHLLASGLLIAYSTLLVKIMIFKEVPMIRIGGLMLSFGGSQTGPANLIPFKTIMIYLFGDEGLVIGTINLLGNIVLLVPVGFLAPLVFRNGSWKTMLSLAVLAGFSIETTQVILQIGIFDIDDVILNAIGVVVGFWLFLTLKEKIHSTKVRNSLITAVIAIIIVTAAGFYGFGVFQNGRLPFSLESRPTAIESDSLNKGGGGADPCGGTGGTGQIVNIDDHTVTIKGSKGDKLVLKLTRHTSITSSAGPAAESDLKIGMGITIVTLESDKEGHQVANAIMICK